MNPSAILYTVFTTVRTPQVAENEVGNEVGDEGLSEGQNNGQGRSTTVSRGSTTLKAFISLT